MFRWMTHRRYSPIGVDLGSRSIKLLQLSGDRSRVVEAARVELPPLGEKPTAEEQKSRLVDGLRRALEGRSFHGRDAVICLNDRQMFLQSVRVPKQSGAELDRAVSQEAAGRIPFGLEEAEIRYLESADVRHGDTTLREVVVFACQRSTVRQALSVLEAVRLNPVAVDVEPAALVRSYAGQFRRDEDRKSRALMVHVGYSRSAAIIAQGDDLLFVKYVEIGGQHFDQAVARHLRMEMSEAVSLRKHNGDRRSEMQDPEVARSVAEAIRPQVERLASELAMCVRYHSVTFRGQPLLRLVLGGGEATPQLLELLGRQIDLKCELSDPFRVLPVPAHVGRKGQWDVAAGLAFRELN
ncbi:MAG: pilus assembly protein PilM [Pirellulaceae bacterium]|jgi:type IV pilus assembly protein PilM|nr:pilus assembly protein PilM [Pirellulaceae bacterium]